MKILLFSYNFPVSVGETGDVLYYLFREYADNSELQIDLVTPSDDEKQHLFKFGDNISIHKLPIIKKPGKINFQTTGAMFRYAWEAYKFSRNLIRENNYNLTHAFSAFPCGAISYMLKWKSGLPYIISLQKSDIQGYDNKFLASHNFIRRIVKKIWNNAYFIFANNQELAQSAMESQPGKEVGIIYDRGVDVHDFFPNAVKTNPDYFTIVCVSHIIPQKGVRFLIQAFKIISGRYRQARLVIAGDGNERISLEQLAQGLEIKDKIFFAGAIPHENVTEYYQKADVFVLPSLEDKISNAVLEALACGLPVITTDTKMTREIISDNENCLFVKMKDSNDLIEKIEKLILNRDFGREIGKGNRILAEQRLSWKVIADNYLNNYRKIKKY